MKRFRLSTLLLLIAIIALCSGLAVQYQRALRREAELRARLERITYDYTKLRKAFEAQLQPARRQSSAVAPRGEQ